MELIERYILEVAKQLPENQREEVSKRVRRDIERRLPPNPTERDVYVVLKEMGDPWLLADQYQPVKKYIIGPSFYRPYLWALKVIVFISIVLAAVFTVFDWALNLGATPNFVAEIVSLTTQLGVSVINSGIQAAFWVTLAFVLIEKWGVGADKLPFMAKDWTPDKLPKNAGNDRTIIPRSETAFELLFLAIYAGIFLVRPQWLGMYSIFEGDAVQAVPLFNLARLQFYLPILLLLFVFDLILVIWKLIWGRWYQSLAVTNFIFNMATVGFLILLSVDNQLLNADFFVHLSNLFENSTLSISEIQRLSIRLTLAIVILYTMIDSALPFFKLHRAKARKLRLG